MPSSGDSFDEFFRHDIKALVQVLAAAGFGHEQAQDAAMDAMLQAFLEWSRVSSPRPYVRATARRIAIRHARRDRDGVARAITAGWAKGGGEQCDPFATVDDALDGLPPSFAVLAALPNRQREVMTRHLQGYTNEEIGEQLQMSPATVRSNLRHGKQTIKVKLAAQDQPPSAGAQEEGVHRDR